MNKFIMVILSAILFVACSSDEPDINNNGNNPNESELFGEILPTTDWGIALQEVKSMQSSELYLITETANYLRYINEQQDIVIDYNFENGKLIASSLTQSNINSITEIVKCCLTDYIKVSESETTLLYYLNKKSTLAYGKIIQGNEFKYASVAWTYVDPNEEDTSTEPDFSPSGVENGYAYVDLGLGIGWAVQNIGAESPEQNGGYYMWGETVSRSNSWWWYYSLYTGDTNSYLDETKFRTPYSDISRTNYDAAKVKMGGNWRMPTRAECTSLINNCEIKKGTYNDVEGFVITGPSGKSIFIPKAGQKKKEDIRSSGVSANIWTSITDGKSYAYYISINGIAEGKIDSWQKYYGMSVRGVIDIK